MIDIIIATTSVQENAINNLRPRGQYYESKISHRESRKEII